MDLKVKVVTAHLKKEQEEYLKKQQQQKKHFCLRPILLSLHFILNCFLYNTQQISLLNATNFFHCYHSEFRLWNRSEKALT